ncbi:Protein SGT1 A [Mortierella sp. GBA30]|nr:Protein SGT1 A [Mortierella sp. GBA30]
MSTVQDLFAQGSHSFADEDYELALSYYSQAIAIHATHAEIYLKRSVTYQKLGKNKEAYDDAVSALGFIKENPSTDVNVEAKAYLRKGVAAYHLQDYQNAKVALESCQALSPEQHTLASWMLKNEQELKKLPKPATETAVYQTPATSPASTPILAPLTPAAHRVRHEWYQNNAFVTISVFIKNAKRETVDVNVTENALSVSVKMPTGSDYSLELDPLSHKVVPAESKFEVLSTKIEIQLKKEAFAIKWGTLEGEDVHVGSMATLAGGRTTTATPSYPSSSKKTKNWDALEKEASKDEERADGDKALNQLFAQIYKDADDDTKRAMMKSFTESNGTCLSTNWDEVGKGPVETRPPEGMVAKKSTMRLSKASAFLVVCAAAILVTVAPVAQAQLEVLPSKSPHGQPSNSAEHPTPPATSSTTTTTTTTQATESPRPTQVSTQVPVLTSLVPVKTSAPVASRPASTASAAPTSTAGVVPPTDGSCSNSSQCTQQGTFCALTSANSTLGSCVSSGFVCEMSPQQICSSHSECTTTAFSYCGKNKGGQMVCSGLGTPGTSTECKNPDANSGVTTTLKYAGIAVGCVAALGVAFALVRWQRRRQRSKGIPADMFGEIDYGMTDRSSPSKGAEQNYPFSNRPNAHGSDHAPPPPGFDYDNNNQYYEEPVGYTNNNGYGHDQYYDQQQHGGGGHGGHGGHGGEGYYDNNAGYDDYQQHPQAIASPAAAARSPRQNFDHYGAEPSELDFGGHHGGSGHGGHGGGGGYGRY